MTDYVLANPGSTEGGVVLDCLCSVVQEIRDLALQGEISGILLGTKDDTGVRILAFRRMVPKRTLGHNEMLSEADREALARLIWAPPADNELYGLEPVGWFRAQPRRDLELSGWELELLNRFFTGGRQVGMILRSASFGPVRARFYMREPSGFQAHVYRDLIVPVASGSPMLRVEPEAPHPVRSEPLLPPLERFRPPRPEAEIEPEEPRAGPNPVWGWIWRTVSSLAIAAFVLGYWWVSSGPQQTGDAGVRQKADIAADADRRAALPAPPETPLKLDDPLPSDDRPAEPELANLAKDPNPPDEKIEPPQPPPEQQLDPAARKSPERSAPPPPAHERSAERSAPPPPAHDEALKARPLHPFRVITPPQKSLRAPDLSAPPQLAGEASPAFFAPLPQSLTVVPPPKVIAAKNTAPAVPANGSLIWTGRLQKNSTVVIDGRTASFGTVTGELPGRPVQFHVYPGDLADNGILVFTDREQDSRKGWDSAGPQNGWNRIMYEFDPHHAEGVEVQEAPGPANSWKRLVLRCTNSKLSVIYVKWALAR